MKGTYPTEVLCEAFCVSRSGYYQWLERPNSPSARVGEDLELAQRQHRGTSISDFSKRNESASGDAAPFCLLKNGFTWGRGS
jgi:hypothetical protein